jgi:hypothetical protein
MDVPVSYVSGDSALFLYSKTQTHILSVVLYRYGVILIRIPIYISASNFRTQSNSIQPSSNGHRVLCALLRGSLQFITTLNGRNEVERDHGHSQLTLDDKQ